eukprot:Lithocolla_globosa_v1_NODE_1843_length_2300_cov_12.534076.p1 type:complete len:502 gc:universal NODE_1843_length_2300_cov_12.534076:1530-25(-)
MNALLLPRAQWVSDDDVEECMRKDCGAVFTALNRRHHCRQCGEIFCGDCSSKKVALPQLGFDKPQRVCESCVEVAYLVAYTVSDSLTTQCHGVRGLIALMFKEGGLEKLVNVGGLDALIYLCSSDHSDVQEITTSALENLARFEQTQNTMVEKGVLNAVFQLTTNKEPSETTLHNIASTLFHLAKNKDLCELMVAEGGLHPLLRIVMSFVPEKNEHDGEKKKTLLLAQTLAARALSLLCMDRNAQARIIEDKKNGLDSLFSLLSSPNEDVQKYIAKSFAYLSLRNDKLKAKLIKPQGARALVLLLGITSSPSISSRHAHSHQKTETLSHVCCTLANLATNGESQEVLVSNENFLEMFVGLIHHKQTTQDTDSGGDQFKIHRHITRGLANLALYDQNKLRLLPIIANELVPLAWNNTDLEVQRHVVRAIDNVVTLPEENSCLELRHAQAVLMKAKTNELLKQLMNESSSQDVSRRASSALTKLLTSEVTSHGDVTDSGEQSC